MTGSSFCTSCGQNMNTKVFYPTCGNSTGTCQYGHPVNGATVTSGAVSIVKVISPTVGTEETYIAIDGIINWNKQ